MDYNVDSVKVIRCEGARIKATIATRLAKSDHLPEYHFLKRLSAPNADGYIAIDKFWWHGDGSGNVLSAS